MSPLSSQGGASAPPPPLTASPLRLRGGLLRLNLFDPGVRCDTSTASPILGRAADAWFEISI